MKFISNFLRVIRNRIMISIHVGRYLITIALFFLFLMIGFSLEGPPRCRDGSYSGSIGSRGACSHHGGVKKTGSLSFALAIWGSIISYFAIGCLYRSYGNYLVLSWLPPHPLEGEIHALPSKRLQPFPSKQAKARENWNCVKCKGEIRKGDTYSFHSAGRYSYPGRVRYCFPCVDVVAGENAPLIKHNQERESLLAYATPRITEYYQQNEIRW